MNFPVFDLHCDTVSELCRKNVSLRSNQLHIDLERGKSLPGYTQCFGFWSTTDLPLPRGMKIEELFWRQVSYMLDELDRNKDLIRLARSGDDVRKHASEGLMSAILTIEGPANIGFDPAKLQKLHNLGFRISSLGWNEKNCLTGSQATGGGLTKRGREYVKECQRLGILVDVSHISDEAFWQIMDMTEKPVIATHSNCRSLCDHPRNLTDEMFKAICQSGGVAGFNMYPDIIGENPDLDSCCDHIFRFLELDPDGSHIALGGDLDGIGSTPAGFAGVQDYPKLAQKLLQRGLDENAVMNIFWNNALGVINKCSM